MKKPNRLSWAISAWFITTSVVMAQTTPPQVTIQSVILDGGNYIVTYSPHEATDADGDPLTYLFTWTDGPSPVTFTDNDHTGACAVPASALLPHTNYTVSCRSYDGKDYTDAANTFTVSTPNTEPGASSFLEIPRTCDAYTIKYAPHEEKDADNDPLIYIFTFTGTNFSANFTDNEHSGEFRVPANLLAPHSYLNVTGVTSDGIASVPFTNSINIQTYNAPPPEITINDVLHDGSNYLIKYSPHVETDDDNDPLTYIFTVTAGGGFSRTYTDLNHTGACPAPASDFKPHSTYTVHAKTYDGIEYTESGISKDFSTPNTLPSPPQILDPREGQHVTATAGEIRFQYRTDATDPDGDAVVTHMTVKGPGLDTTLVMSGTQGTAGISRFRFASAQSYSATIESTDGIGTVVGNSINFYSPNTSGIDREPLASGWSAFPNPTSGRLVIHLEDMASTPIETVVFDNEGRSLAKFLIPDAAHESMIDLRALPEGVYYLKVNGSNGTTSKLPVLRILITSQTGR